jgi:sulfatase modifying factor 1
MINNQEGSLIVRDIRILNKLFVVFFLTIFMATLLSTSAWALSPKLEAKKNWLGAEKALEQEDYSKAISYLEKMKSLKVKLKPEYYFQYGRSLVKSGKFKEGLKLLNSYIEKAGDEGEYVEWALELMNEAENPTAPPNMAFIPGGEFMSGENADHTILIGNFFIDKYEVTQADYEKVMGKNPSHYKGDNLPVDSVTWQAANDFCGQEGKRLPTEAEWEKAARGGTTSTYYWGDEYDGAYAWTSENSGYKTQDVGQKKPNNFDLYDMSGNVYEWVSDWHDKDYFKNAPRNKPKGPSSGKQKVLRGGSGRHGTYAVKAAYRDGNDPSVRYVDIGFRCAQ